MNNGEISGTGKPEMNCLELDQGWFAKKRAAFRFAVASSLWFEIGAKRRHCSRNLPSIHRGLFCQTLPNYFNLRWRISPMRVGLALPRLSFITWPLRKLRAAALPDRKSAAGPGLAAMRSEEHTSELQLLRHLVCR